MKTGYEELDRLYATVHNTLVRYSPYFGIQYTGKDQIVDIPTISTPLYYLYQFVQACESGMHSRILDRLKGISLGNANSHIYTLKVQCEAISEALRAEVCATQVAAAAADKDLPQSVDLDTADQDISSFYMRIHNIFTVYTVEYWKRYEELHTGFTHGLISRAEEMTSALDRLRRLDDALSIIVERDATGPGSDPDVQSAYLTLRKEAKAAINVLYGMFTTKN